MNVFGPPHPNPPGRDRKIKYVNVCLYEHTWTLLGKKQQKPSLYQASRRAVGNYQRQSIRFQVAKSTFWKDSTEVFR